MRLVSGPQGPHVVLDGKPVLSLCSDNYLGLADHPRVREAAAEAAMRWGVSAGLGRLDSGTMTLHRRLEERLAAVRGPRDRAAVRLGLPGQPGRGRRAGPARRRRLLRRARHPRSLDGCRLSGAEVFVYDHCDTEHLAWGIRAGGRARRADRDRQRVLDRRRLAPLPEIVELADAASAAAAGRRVPRDRRARSRRTRRARRPRARGSRRRDRAARSARRSAPTAAFVACDRTMAKLPGRRGADVLPSRPRPRRRRSAARWPRSSC